MKNKNMEVKGVSISVFQTNKDDYISLTDIAKSKDGDSRAADIIKNWIRNRGTIEFIGTWEALHNSDFKVVEFDHFRMNAGLTSFVLSPGKWVERTNAIGIVVKGGRYGGTYAHKDIAFEFCSAISPIFKLYLIKEFQRLKDEEQKQLGWDIKRNLTKINYRIHTDAIKTNLLPKSLSKKQISIVYANEADVLNMALFGKTAKQWRSKNPDKKGNIRDYANVSQLVCLANLENLNAVFINDGYEQSPRLEKLNQIAISQMKLLIKDNSQLLKDDTVWNMMISWACQNGSKKHLGKTALIDKDYNYAFGGFMGMLTHNKEIYSKFLYWKTRNKKYFDFILNLTDGANINNLRFNQLSEFKIPIPPLAEQKQIVKKLDQLNQQTQTLEQNYQNQLKSLLELKQSLLEKAFNGELV